ncbi:glycosyl transferase family 2 [Algoriphagus aquaeductus]|uniref:Glycosyl transferase family 2 n=1 Tax=Algoriphagus aquaeductus TaxID=475299 RepID=A0A326RRR9_9BACT|nr:glycosyltransferase family A protein [Algoriphagus aquaeductus]PZV76702.1 glycosyl transferase family 2 [Algoriphagus aquaeductus]
MELVSVIIPVFNSEKFVELAISSALILPQVGEVVVVDDGSTDRSLEICLNLQKKDRRINVLVHPKNSNRGAAESRNLGIKNVNFPLVAFLDSDDKYFENRFDESVQILSTNPSIMGCFGQVLVNYLDANYQKLMGVPVGMDSKKLFSHILNGGYFHTNSLTIRKSYLERIGGFDQSCWPHEDVELWTRLAYHGKLVSISSEMPIAEYTIHGKNLSQLGNWKSKWALWSTVFWNFFFNSISLTDRYFILKQLIKAHFGRFKGKKISVKFSN